MDCISLRFNGRRDTVGSGIIGSNKGEVRIGIQAQPN